jgi:hypothetical protein
LVWPVFYQVEPSDVRHQKGSYAKALANHERKKTIDKAKVKRWKLALQEASNLVGWHYKDGCVPYHSFLLIKFRYYYR